MKINTPQYSQASNSASQEREKRKEKLSRKICYVWLIFFEIFDLRPVQIETVEFEVSVDNRWREIDMLLVTNS